MKRVTLVAAAMFIFYAAFSQVPGTLSYQGILVNSSGAPVADGNHTVTFNFYTAATGGIPVFARGQFNVTTYKGMFTLVLGTGVPDNTVNGPLPVLTTDPNYIGGSQYYIELVADNVILAPRVQLSSVPYAIHAQNANTMSAAGLTGTANLPNTVLDTDLQDLADGSLTDTRLETIGTAGKVSGNAITSGTIGGSTAINTSGNIATTGTGTLTVNGSSIFRSAIGLGASPDYGTAGKVLTSQGVGVAPIWSTVSGGGGWGLTGNAGTVDGTNFIGTTDNVPLNFRVNNVKAGRIDGANNFFGYQAGNAGGGNQSTGIGYQALYSNTTGNSNTALGYEALLTNTIGGSNTGLGFNTLYSNTTGVSNVASGHQALYLNTIGNTNVAMGTQSLYSNVAGSSATAIGTRAMQFANSQAGAFTNTNVAVGFETLRGSTTASANTGNENTAIGYQAMFNNSTGTSNVANGFMALNGNAAGINNVAIGAGALQVAINSHNTAVGHHALYNTINAIANVATGTYSLNNNISGNLNTAYGYNSLYFNKEGSNATAIGYGAMANSNDSSTPFTNSNVAVGYEALRGSTTASANTGNNNTATGYQTMFANTTGSANTASGYQALSGNTSGMQNVGFGYESLIANSSGSANTAVGWHSLYSNTTGANNTALGYGADVTTGALTKATAIGYNAKVATSNSLVLGGTGADAVKVGIGTTSPTVTLDVVGTDAAKMPSGTTAQRPSSPSAGMLRYNSTESTMEYYNGTNWYFLVPKIAFVKDVRASGTNGGNATGAIWNIRSLNTIEGDGSFVSLSDPRITISAGEYIIEVSAPNYQGLHHKLKLRDVAGGGTDIAYGTSEYSGTGGDDQHRAFLITKLTLATSITFEVQQFISNTIATYGLGLSTTGSGVNETYTQVKITKLR